MNEVQFPHSSVILFDENGRMTREGHRFFFALWSRTGAGSGNLDVSIIDDGTNASATTFARGDGTWAVPNYPTGANPSAQIGTTSTAGSAATFMRSDAAPAINQAITPTWTGVHAFDAGITSTATIQGNALVATNGFGCNGALAQTEVTVNGSIAGTAGAAYTATEQGLINSLLALVNQLRGALVANGICV